MIADVHIEFAHIYAGLAFGAEQEAGAKLLLENRRHLEVSGKKVVSSIMVDDIHGHLTQQNLSNILASARFAKACPDYLIPESACAGGAEIILSRIQPSLVRTDRIRKDGSISTNLHLSGFPVTGLSRERANQKKHSCALLSAAWSLVKIGVLELDAIHSMKAARQALTILPEHYRKTELKALAILIAAGYSDRLSAFHYLFFRADSPIGYGATAPLISARDLISS